MRRQWLAASIALLMGVAGCSGKGLAPASSSSSVNAATTPPAGTPVADQAARLVVDALNSHDISSLVMTVPGKQAQDELTTIFSGMDGHYPRVSAGSITYEANQAVIPLTMSWNIGVNGWQYSTTARMEYLQQQWKLLWQPNIIHPELTTESRLRFTQKDNKRAAIYDLAGTALVEQRPVYQVGIDKTRITQTQWMAAAQQLAQALAIDPAAYQQKVAAAGSKAFVVAATMEQKDIPAATAAVPGLYVKETSAVVGPSKTFAAPILGTVGEPTAEMIQKSEGKLSSQDVVGLSGLQYRYDSQLRGVPLIRVDLVRRSSTASPSASPSQSPSEEKAVFQQDASVGTPITISLDRELQAKAESVLSDQSELATLVVIDVHTGAVVVAAQSPTGGTFPHSTSSTFSPGSTFKVATSLALLRQGYAPSSQVECPHQLQVSTFTFTNYSSYPSSATGTIPLESAFKYSCNTAFVGAASKINEQQLQQAAGSLGLGIDYDAGFSVNFGQVKPGNSIDLAASMIGQGEVAASPLAMAGVAASVASGKTVIPWLVKDHQASSTAQPLSAAEASALQQMMTATVDSGTGTVVKQIMTGAKTGTAGFGDSGQSHAWMIAYNDKYAVSAFVKVGESGGATAGPLIVKLFS